MTTYTKKTEAGDFVVRSPGEAVIPWDPAKDCPADIQGRVYRIWEADGSPASLPYEPPPPAMPSLSPTQLALGLFRSGADIIPTLEDAKKFAAAGETPPQIEALLNQIPDQAQREVAIVRTAAAQSYDWDNPITQFIGSKVGQALGWGPDEFQARWLDWSTI